jgi:hypothetical protein
MNLPLLANSILHYELQGTTYLLLVVYCMMNSKVLLCWYPVYYNRKKKDKKKTQHSFSVTIFTLGFRLFFILLQINLNLKKNCMLA